MLMRSNNDWTNWYLFYRFDLVSNHLFISLQLLLKLEDNRLVETVGIPVKDDEKGSMRLTACVSSQVIF